MLLFFGFILTLFVIFILLTKSVPDQEGDGDVILEFKQKIQPYSDSFIFQTFMRCPLKRTLDKLEQGPARGEIDVFPGMGPSEKNLNRKERQGRKEKDLCTLRVILSLILILIIIVIVENPELVEVAEAADVVRKDPWYLFSLRHRPIECCWLFVHCRSLP